MTEKDESALYRRLKSIEDRLCILEHWTLELTSATWPLGGMAAHDLKKEIAFAKDWMDWEDKYPW